MDKKNETMRKFVNRREIDANFRGITAMCAQLWVFTNFIYVIEIEVHFIITYILYLCIY
jgi:hypothetical protein